MRLSDIVAAALDGAGAGLGGATAKLRRNAVLYAILAFCAAAAVIIAASAAILALEPEVGTVYARLIVSAVFATVGGSIALAAWLAGRSTKPVVAPASLHAQAQTMQRTTQFAQLAMIVEAVLLGYSMARRR
jgi:hypothetical protein